MKAREFYSRNQVNGRAVLVGSPVHPRLWITQPQPSMDAFCLCSWSHDGMTWIDGDYEVSKYLEPAAQGVGALQEDEDAEYPLD